MARHLLKKSNLTVLLDTFQFRLELIEGLTSLHSEKQRFEYETVIKLLDNELLRQ